MYNRLLIAVDGSDEATHAARYGLELADIVGAAVDLVYVIPRRSLQMTRTERERTRLRERGNDILSAVAELADADTAVETHLAEGTPAAEISSLAADLNADLLVVGRQGMTGVGRRVLGGVTERVLARGEVPICVVPLGESASAAADCDRLLVPTDGSDNAAAAVPHAAALATASAAAVDVLNVVDLQAAGGPFNVGGLDTAFIERLETRGADAVETIAENIADAAPEISVNTAVERMTDGNGAAAGIRAYVEANEIDLVVMGSHGRSNLRRGLLGSVASVVLQTVDIPVVIVKQGSIDSD